MLLVTLTTFSPLSVTYITTVAMLSKQLQMLDIMVVKSQRWQQQVWRIS